MAKRGRNPYIYENETVSRRVPREHSVDSSNMMDVDEHPNQETEYYSNKPG
jgi:hypothetical protein